MSFLLISVVQWLSCEFTNLDNIVTHKNIFVLVLNIYARISLSMQNKFDSKHALALWELCLDFLDKIHNYGETPFVPLERLRELMGIPETMYPQFKEFNRRVIKEPIEEVNAKTDFQITVEYQRMNRQVIAVRFKFRRILQLPAQHAKQATGGCAGT